MSISAEEWTGAERGPFPGGRRRLRELESQTAELRNALFHIGELVLREAELGSIESLENCASVCSCWTMRRRHMGQYGQRLMEEERKGMRHTTSYCVVNRSAVVAACSLIALFSAYRQDCICII
jgi:hypothetical protein